MGEKDFLVDAVAQFLQTNEWQEAITQFFAVHYAQFVSEAAEEKQSEGVGYTLEQYQVFTQFRDLMERLLENIMGELGCTGEDLVAILQESVRNGPTGERRFLIKSLLSFEDYIDFHSRIAEYAAQQQQQCEIQQDGSAERNEWEMQLAMAQSLLDANAQGLLNEDEQSFLPWAEALVGMGHSNPAEEQLQDVASESKEETASGASAEVDNGADARLKQLEYTLIKERLKVDLLVAQRIAEANSVLKKDMLHLSAVEVEQSEQQEFTSAEQNLEALFTQIEKVRDRLNIVKSQCFAFKNVNQDSMDKMYLFLKEKVHYQQDLVSQEKKIAEFIFGLIDQSDAPLIPLLLEWLLLESEALRIQGQIQEDLGQDVPEPSGFAAGDGNWTQSWDENAQAFFYFHSVTGESVWEPPSIGFYDANQEYHVPDASAYGTVEAKIEEQEEDIVSRPNPMAASLHTVASELDERISASTPETPTDMFEMESILERISREHDQERKRLELVFELEKARQKEELRRRKEKKRREKHLKKKKKADRRRDNENGEDPDDIQDANNDRNEEAVEAALMPVVSTPRQAAEGKADAKDTHDEGISLAIPIPGRGRLDLAHLLSEEHAKRQLERNGLTVPLAPAPQALLNPTSLRYLAETLAKKNIELRLDQSPKSSRQFPPPVILLEELDEK